jgi:hypothetical protein
MGSGKDVNGCESYQNTLYACMKCHTEANDLYKLVCTKNKRQETNDIEIFSDLHISFL